MFDPTMIFGSFIFLIGVLFGWNGGRASMKPFEDYGMGYDNPSGLWCVRVKGKAAMYFVDEAKAQAHLAKVLNATPAEGGK